MTRKILCIGGELDHQCVDDRGDTFAHLNCIQNIWEIDETESVIDYNSAMTYYHIHNLFFGKKKYYVYVAEGIDRDSIFDLLFDYYQKKD